MVKGKYMKLFKTRYSYWRSATTSVALAAKNPVVGGNEMYPE